MNTIKKILLIFSIKEKIWLLILIISSFVTSLLEVAGLGLVIPYVNLVLLEENYREYSELTPVIRWMLSLSGDYRIDATLWFILFYIFKNTLLVSITFLQQLIMKNLHANIVCRMHHNLMNKPYSFHLKSNSSGVIRSITYDAMHFGDGVISQSCILIAELFLLIGIVSILAFKSIEALLVLIILILTMGLILTVLKNRLVNWGKILQQRESKIISQLQEGFGGIKDVIVSGSKGFFEDKFEKNILIRSRIRRNRDFTLLIPRFFIETLMMLSMAGILLWMIRHGGLQKNFALIAFLTLALVRMLPMSNRIMSSLNTIKGCKQSVNVVFDNALISLNKSETSKVQKVNSKRKEFNQIDVLGLKFGYHNNNLLLNDINFSIKNNELIGIVGKSGCGKTTLVDILLGLLKPCEGQILLDGKFNIHSYSEEWQQRIGYVQQNIFILDASIKANIAFGIRKEDIDNDLINDVLIQAKLDQWVMSLPDGLDTSLGERGVSISGGQKQRIGIARALYRRPDVLILDEATSALDNITEKELIADLISMEGKYTIIMVAHRLNTIAKCDRIIVLENGKISDIGTYNALMGRNSVFQEISNYKTDE